MKFPASLPVVFFTLIASCSTPEERGINKFSDPVVLHIADLTDRRLADSLYPFFNHENPLYRREAVKGFGSIQTVDNVDRIGKLLTMDSDAGVRRAAAFALGQTGHPNAERILLGALVKEKSPENTAEILHAYGKTTSKWDLDPNNFLGDSLRSAGVAWSLYRAGLRGNAGPEANAAARQLLDGKHSRDTRLGAAHYFARAAKDFPEAGAALIHSATKDPSPEVRMASALGLGKTASDSALAALKDIIKTDPDSRVIINALRALRHFDYRRVRHYLYEALAHKDVNVGIASSEVIIETLPADDWIEVSSIINQIDNWRISANLYEAALKAGGNRDLAAEIMDRYQETKAPYERAWLLVALQHYPPAFDFVLQQLRSAKTPLIRSSAATALAGMARHKSATARLKPRFGKEYQSLIESQDDPAVIGTIASALADSTLNFREVVKDVSFLYEAKKKLRLPAHVEALNPVNAAISYLDSGKPAEAIKPEFNHPVDWDLVRKIPENQRATIKTARGNMVIRLFVNEAPGSVANFVALARSGYFKDKAFHRVVPNFVVQAGCNRGDGWGSEDYSIRSEFSTRLYGAGSVGMASAGKDTEGTQWFITHSPTPHLDGRYTLFAEVLEGMQVLEYLQVGDVIADVEVGDFTDH